MKSSDKIICIKKYANFIENDYYTLGTCASTFSALGYKYFIHDNTNYYYFNDRELKKHFISVQEYRKQKLVKINQTR